MTKKLAIICDIDGTVADITHRLHYIKGPLFPKDIVRRKGVPNSKDSPGLVQQVIPKLHTDVQVSWLTGGFSYEASSTLTKVPSYDAFFKYVKDDTPIDTTIALVSSFARALECGIVFCSGRPEKTRDDTIDWLREHFPMGNVDELFMRQDGDYRKDSVVKEDILKKCILPDYEVICAFEDRQRVVDMWRRNNIQTYQVADGDF